MKKLLTTMVVLAVASTTTMAATTYTEKAVNKLVNPIAKTEASARNQAAQAQKAAQAKKDAAIKAQKAQKAKAEAFKKAQQQKLVNENEVAAEVAKAERMTELKEKEVALKERELDALVRKQADADRYKMVQEAEAQKEARIAKAQAEKEAATLEAEAIKAKALAEADGIKAKLEAEADGIKAKGLAEAAGIEKKAEAQAKMKQASIVEMICKVLPDIAKEVSTPLANVDTITMYGDQSTKLVEENTQKIDKVLKVAQDGLGIDLKSLVAGFAAKTLVDDHKESKSKKVNE